MNTPSRRSAPPARGAASTLRIAALLVACASGAAACDSTPGGDAGGLDARAQRPFQVQLRNRPALACNQVELQFDVARGDILPRPPDARFEFTLVDATHDTVMSRASEECPASTSADAGIAPYRVCFTGLMPLTDYYVQIRATLGSETILGSTFFRTPDCPEGGAGDAATDAGTGMDSGAMDAGGMDAGGSVDSGGGMDTAVTTDTGVVPTLDAAGSPDA